MTLNHETVLSLLHGIQKMENDIVKLKQLAQTILEQTGGEGVLKNSIESAAPAFDDSGIKVVEGKFDGVFMVGDDTKIYPVPMNYSSKTKLIPGDRLKLRIMEDGRLMYKLIAPAPRKYVKAKLSKTDEGKFIALTEDSKTYSLNQAAVTFFKGNVGNEISLIINAEQEYMFGALEAVISK